MKRRILGIAVVVLLLAMAIGSTTAYFNTSKVATNIITAGNVEIELVEKTRTAEGLKPFEPISGAMPGKSYSKIVTVKNLSEQPLFVRIRVEKAITPAPGSEAQLSPDMIHIDELEKPNANWTKQGDYWVYNKILNPMGEAGSETEPLFENVTFDKDMDNIYQNCKVEIKVSAQAVQQKNNGEDQLAADGWPQAAE